MKDKNKINLAIPGKPISQKKFMALIKEAEQGLFVSIEESRKQFDKWRAKIKKSIN